MLAALYLGFVFHFATNEPVGDDWNVVPLIHSALHGQLTLSGLWAQHLESRIFFPNLVFVVSGFIDHFDIRTIILLSAVIYIVCYFILLRLYREYDGHPLTAIPCVVLGLIWFSFADVKNALWAFQVAWFMVVFCFVILIYLFSVSSLNRSIALAISLLVAVVASYSALQGFVLWPLGLFLLFWKTPWSRRTYIDAGIWMIGCVTAVVLLLRGYSQLIALGTCPAAARCQSGYLVGHLSEALLFFFRVVGNVYPTTANAVGAQEIIGAVLALISIVIVVASFRERRVRLRVPLPSAIILFSLVFDAMIVYGRFGYGTPALQYVMPQVMLLAGIATYLLPRISRGHFTLRSRRSLIIRGLYFCSVIPLLLWVIGTTSFGVMQARQTQKAAITEARLVVNLSRIPDDQRFCYEGIILGGGIWSGALMNTVDAPIFKDAKEDGLSLFSPGAFKIYYSEGPPNLSGCRPRHGEAVPTH
ncbi:MAG TPA: hypothetical protein VMU99_08475 [Acidimicrobiales bacterium]|nr:hypothetical protein [Acidimicrobiales bacterium]